jgi:hypothetical protein
MTSTMTHRVAVRQFNEVQYLGRNRFGAVRNVEARWTARCTCGHADVCHGRNEAIDAKRAHLDSARCPTRPIARRAKSGVVHIVALDPQRAVCGANTVATVYDTFGRRADLLVTCKRCERIARD